MASKGDLIKAAKTFAQNRHRKIMHTRKYSGEPYEFHLEAVAALIETTGRYSEEVIAAAWLHDVVEDTGTPICEIETRFGGSVARLVSELTDISKPKDGNRAIRKKLDREHLARSSAEAKTIKLADLIHNAESIVKYDQKFAGVFVREMSLLLQVLKEGDQELWHKADGIVTRYVTQNL